MKNIKNPNLLHVCTKARLSLAVFLTEFGKYYHFHVQLILNFSIDIKKD